ncbi:Neutral/alkaline nonlysosomal ceramidase [Trichodelitschia bisporula]|uniref:Neutral ceramidase n=1 Tax=Trichodelitschia bisporula TaxID=703511 RepID=A0A6G1HTS3_9PEZI|nr:Neutral/alkaline nonlysosomal ceramidase [Trichodelitschia bisporula]
MSRLRTLAIAVLVTSALTFLIIQQFYAESLREFAYSWFNGFAQEDRIVKGREYLIGAGKADITGPVVEINLMGYADPNQTGTGLRQRLYSRAFIVGSPKSPEDRWVYLVLDTQSGDTAIRHGILEGLRDLGTEYVVYRRHNVAVTGTHSHSGPAAWLNYLLPQITSRGFDKQSYDAIVTGAIRSIQRAHESLVPGRLSIGTTDVDDGSINRSLYAYLANPTEEREKYSDSVDRALTLLRLTRASDGKDIGVLTWFAVHGTSLHGNNTLITGDNKGVAAYLLEKAVKASSSAAPGFVAGFSQANVGDTSPNVLGAFCEDGSGDQCKLEDSTCNGRNQACHGRGPHFGLDDSGTKSCFEIGRRQFHSAKTLYDAMTAEEPGAATPVTGRSIRALHTFADISNYSFSHPNGSIVRTCPAALGYSFAAGTSDGPGAFDFTQNNPGDPSASPMWTVVRDLLHKPSEEQIACQAPKPILLDAGESKKPYDWAPNIVDIQLLRVGQVVIIVSPGEATTMAGRRWRDAVRVGALDMGLLADAEDTAHADPVVLLGGPANSYTHYITTEEEYGIQRYEGASTLYGPHTLNAYINLTLSNLHFLAAGAGSPEHGPAPPVNTNRSLSFIRGVVVDNPGFFKSFGDVLEDVEPQYERGHVASVVFVGANPRNNLRLEDTFASVERWTGNDDYDDELRLRERGEYKDWERVLSDEDWELVFHWERTNTALGMSRVKIEWEIGGHTKRGRYRLRYFGDSKSLGGTITSFEGVSSEFLVI